MGYRLLPRHAQPPNHGRPAVPRARPPTRQLRTTPQETANPLASDKASTRRLDRCAPDILHVSPKTVSRWAKEGKLPFLKTLGGHRRYPAAEIRQLADELQVQPTA